MKLNRAMKLQSEAQSKLRDLFSRARIYRLSHERMLEDRGKIYAGLKGCPRWVSASLAGYWDAQTERLYEQELEYCSRQADGKLYSHHSASPNYYGKHGLSAREVCENGAQTGHYWKGTVRPFFVG